MLYERSTRPMKLCVPLFTPPERTVAGYEGEREKTQRDLDIAHGQLSDYEARLGGTFAHAAYLEELTRLRDQLETRLSASEAAPERSATRRSATAEASVTTRIRRRLQDISTPQPEITETDVSPAATHPPTPAPQPVQALQPALFTTPVPRVSPPKPSYRQRATRDERPAKPQLTLF